MVRKYHVVVLPANHVSVLCMELCVSGQSHTQYTYMIGPGTQPHSASGPYKYFSSNLLPKVVSVIIFFFSKKKTTHACLCNLHYKTKEIQCMNKQRGCRIYKCTNKFINLITLHLFFWQEASEYYYQIESHGIEAHCWTVHNLIAIPTIRVCLVCRVRYGRIR